MALSMLIEIALLVVCKLRIPQDNATIAPILFITSPTIAALLCHYRRPFEFFLLSCLAILFTLFLVFVFSRLTGITTGLLPPVVIRTVAGFLAALIVNRCLDSHLSRSPR